MKKPIRLAHTATLLLRAKRVQLVAWVAPLTKVPKIMVMAMPRVRLSPGCTASRPSSPPMSRVAVHSDAINRISIAGTAMRESRSRPL